MSVHLKGHLHALTHTHIYLVGNSRRSAKERHFAIYYKLVTDIEKKVVAII